MASLELTGFEQARATILAAARPLAPERLPLREALGRYLADDIVASEPVPAVDNSAMDGFAVCSADTRGAAPDSPVALRLAGESRAGVPAAAGLAPGEAFRISTGAVLPAGADAVARVENTRIEEDTPPAVGEAGSGEKRILIEAAVAPGHDVRRAGEDIRPAEVVLRAGTRVGPAELGVLASLGAATVPCRRAPRLAVLTSGDELLEPGEAMRPGGVRNSNAYSVPALAQEAGADVSVPPPAPDDPGATRAAIEPLLDRDVLVLCGGVSVGEHDHVKRALAALGVAERFWRVALKPGRPTWFGTHGETLVFGLPGNPVSAMVTFLLFVRPALVALGGGLPERRRITARLAADLQASPNRTQAIRCRLERREDGWLARPTGAQASHVLTSMLGADCLAIVPPGGSPPRAGERVEVELLA
ncbi:MAG TPA: gephyrin-like molybdotransferase Glp [Solirubrobacterales bacterium]|nr:gephyrin-like molybdotransferase Glp [Solirubrobacterales bacterium]